MKKIAVIVEGPSDEIFWEKVLNREFAQECRFKVMCQNNRAKVIQKALPLMSGCRKGGYHSVFFLVDLDKDRCATAVKDLFDPEVLEVASREPSNRFVHICVAKREFEGWLLADELAIQQVLPNAQYVCDAPTDDINAERRLGELLRSDRGAGAGFRKPAFAREVAPHFSPIRAAQSSRSFAYFWKCIATAVACNPS